MDSAEVGKMFNDTKNRRIIKKNQDSKEYMRENIYLGYQKM